MGKWVPTDILGTYISTYTNPSAHPGKGEARLVKSKLDLMKDGMFLMGMLGEWKVQINYDSVIPQFKIIISPEWHRWRNEDFLWILILSVI
jgi:hypothetical protein